MQAVKENRVYTIEAAEVDSFVKDGYDVFEDNGELVAIGAGKSVPYERFMILTALYEDVMEENARLTDEKAKLEDEVAKLEAKLKKRETKKAKEATK